MEFRHGFARHKSGSWPQPQADTGWHRHDNGAIHRDDADCTWLGNPVPCDPPDGNDDAE